MIESEESEYSFDYIEVTKNGLIIIDNAPKEVRAFIHEHDAPVTLQIFGMVMINDKTQAIIDKGVEHLIMWHKFQLKQMNEESHPNLAH